MSAETREAKMMRLENLKQHQARAARDARLAQAEADYYAKHIATMEKELGI